jgi:hypothetical protein
MHNLSQNDSCYLAFCNICYALLAIPEIYEGVYKLTLPISVSVGKVD